LRKQSSFISRIRWVHRFFSYGHSEESIRRRKNRFVESEPAEPQTFAERFSRSYRLLYFIACRVLGDEENAPIAIRNCWRIASRNPPRFEYDGAFRSWLVRVLIDEALAMLRESQNAREAAAAVLSAVSLSDKTVDQGIE